MATIDEMAEKIRRSLSPMYTAPKDFWETRLRIAEERLKYAQERLSKAETPRLRTFWEKRGERAQRRVTYLRKRVEGAKACSGLSPREISERWLKAMTE